MGGLSGIRSLSKAGAKHTMIYCTVPVRRTDRIHSRCQTARCSLHTVFLKPLPLLGRQSVVPDQHGLQVIV